MQKTTGGRGERMKSRFEYQIDQDYGGVIVGVLIILALCVFVLIVCGYNWLNGHYPMIFWTATLLPVLVFLTWFTWFLFGKPIPTETT